MTGQHSIPAPRPPASANGFSADPTSAPTRHLSAAAYLDDEFRDRALSETYDQPRRAIAPSYGFDLTAVLTHCRRSRSMAILRDALLVGIPVVALCASPIAVVSAASWLIGFALTVAGLRFARDAAAGLRSGEPAVNRLRARGLMLLLGVVVWVFLSFAMLSVFATALTAQAFDSGVGEPSGLEDTLLLAFAGTVALLAFWVAGSVVDRLVRQAALERLVPGRSAGAVADTPRMQQIRQLEGGNTTIYSAFLPFVGSGVPLSTWRFAQRLIRAERLGDHVPEAEREYPDVPFSASELKDYVASRLRTLTEAAGSEPEFSLPGLKVSDRIFVPGSHATGISPYTPPTDLDHVVRHPTEAARHYVTSQVVAWRGEVVATVYTHFAVQGRSLYLEMATWALPPCDERYRVVDHVDGTGTGAFLRAAWQGLVNAPGTVGRAPINLAKALASVIASAGGSAAPGIDRGARVSVRELGMGEGAVTYMQTHDILKYTRIVERRVLALVFDFLESRGVDTTEYKQRAYAVLNYGVMTTGGTTNINGSAVGPQASTNNMVPPLPGSPA